MKGRKDEIVAGKFAEGLKKALEKTGKNPDQAAEILKVKNGTMYKYLAGDMIPGGRVLWLACQHLGLVLDAEGFRPRQKSKRVHSQPVEDPQYAFSFINESIEGDKIRAQVRRKDNQYVQVNLRIKVAS